MSSRPKPVPLATDMTETSEVLNTPDLEAFRNFDPTAQIATISPTISAQFDRARRNQAASYAYSGISNPVARMRSQNDANERLDYDQATATAQLFDDAQRRRMGQLGTLADLTASRRNRRVGTQETLPGSNGVGSSAISAGGAIASAAIIAA